ncbi:MAG: hypothetical protein ACPGOY_17605, partial [Rhodospirillaceae bacterium]
MDDLNTPDMQHPVRSATITPLFDYTNRDKQYHQMHHHLAEATRVAEQLGYKEVVFILQMAGMAVPEKDWPGSETSTP